MMAITSANDQTTADGQASINIYAFNTVNNMLKAGSHPNAFLWEWWYRRPWISQWH